MIASLEDHEGTDHLMNGDERRNWGQKWGLGFEIKIADCVFDEGEKKKSENKGGIIFVFWNVLRWRV
jgi:hypothetical protein